MARSNNGFIGRISNLVGRTTRGFTPLSSIQQVQTYSVNYVAVAGGGGGAGGLGGGGGGGGMLEGTTTVSTGTSYTVTVGAGGSGGPGGGSGSPGNNHNVRSRDATGVSLPRGTNSVLIVVSKITPS